jgi:hypothetical protein
MYQTHKATRDHAIHAKTPTPNLRNHTQNPYLFPASLDKIYLLSGQQFGAFNCVTTSHLGGVGFVVVGW